MQPTVVIVLRDPKAWQITRTGQRPSPHTLKLVAAMCCCRLMLSHITGHRVERVAKPADRAGSVVLTINSGSPPGICLLPAILPPSPPAQKPASVCLADHSHTRNSTLLGLSWRDFVCQFDYFLSNLCFFCLTFGQLPPICLYYRRFS